MRLDQKTKLSKYCFRKKTQHSQHSLLTQFAKSEKTTEIFIIPKMTSKMPPIIIEKSFSHDNRYSALNTDNGAQNNDNDIDNGSNYELNNNIKFKNETEQKKNKKNNKNTNVAKNVTVIIGDSMWKDVKGLQLSKSTKTYQIVVRSFFGSTSDDMANYLIPLVQRKPNKLINARWYKRPEKQKITSRNHGFDHQAVHLC